MMWKILFYYVTWLLVVNYCTCLKIELQGDVFSPDELETGPWVQMTSGAIWPKPKRQKSHSTYYVINEQTFEFKLTPESSQCDGIAQSLKRFKQRLFPKATETRRRKYDEVMRNIHFDNHLENDDKYHGVLDELEISLLSQTGCEFLPHDNMDEKYEIFVGVPPTQLNKALLTAHSVWGILRGLESFTHLVYVVQKENYRYQINSTHIQDEPRFRHRGVMLDTSRHFLPKRTILDNLDLMEMNKINTFHWHITDDTSFPYESIKFPDLSIKGAFDPVTHIYTQADISDIIEEARLRGIRVIPEFDIPGHTKSWEPGMPGLLTPCENENGQPTGLYGPMDATKAFTYDFLGEFFEEIIDVFPDSHIHIGGDEVNLHNCWHQNKRIKDTMITWNITNQYKRLEQIFIENVMHIIQTNPKNRKTIVWQEAMDNGVLMNKQKTVVTVWKSWTDGGWQEKIKEVMRKGFHVILSAPWYLNYINYGSDWVKFYKVQLEKTYTPEDSLFLGGEICLWGEFVNSKNAIPRLWPRGSAAAEILWSPDPFARSGQSESNIIYDAAKRLQEHECRMMIRGYPIQPAVGPGHCIATWSY